MNTEDLAQANLQASPDLSHPCLACGLTGAAATSKPKTPFHSQTFDFSPQAHEAVHLIIEEGESKIALLNQAVQRLSTLRDEMVLTVQQHRNLRAPIHRLPEDVLLLVFQHLAGSSPNSLKTPPWEADAVCRRWRSIVTSCPYLWTDFCLEPGSKNMASVLEDCKRLDIQLSRAASLSLKVTINLSRIKHAFCTGIQDQKIVKAINQLLKVSPRCVELHLIGSLSHYESGNVIPPKTPTFHYLKVLTVGSRSWLKTTFLRNTPVVRSVTLINVPLKSAALGLWDKHLDTLHLSWCYASCWDALGALEPLSSSLTRLSLGPWRLSDSGDEEPTSDLLPPVSLVLLETLDLDTGVNRSASFSIPFQRLLRHIQAPNLIRLTLKRFMSEQLQVDAVHHFIQASSLGSTLQSLRMEDCQPSPELVSLLPALPGLRSLDIDLHNGSIADYSTLVQALRWDEQIPQHPPVTLIPGDEPTLPICPNLESLTIGNTATVDQGILEATIRSRARTHKDDHWDGLPRFLDRVEIGKPMSWQSGSIPGLEWYQTMKQEGLI